MSTIMSNENRYTIAPEQLESSKAKEIEKSRPRLKERADLMCEIINRKGREKYGNDWKYFKINGLQQMIEKTLDAIRKWDGGNYNKPVETEQDCYIKTRNHWCREKSKPIANSIIYPVLSQLCQHINQFVSTSPANKVLLYIGIMHSMLNAKIKFPRTSQKPLIPYTMFFKNNKFKEHCRIFIKHFNLNQEFVEWGSVKVTRSIKKSNESKATSKYIPDPQRAQNLHDSFVDHLECIEVEILQCNNMKLLQTQLNCFMIDMDVKMENVNNNQQYDNNRYNDNNQNVEMMNISTPFATTNNNGLSAIYNNNNNNNNNNNHHNVSYPLSTQQPYNNRYNNNGHNGNAPYSGSVTGYIPNELVCDCGYVFPYHSSVNNQQQQQQQPAPINNPSYQQQSNNNQNHAQFEPY